MKLKAYKAFTLMEMLISMVVISILMAVSVPMITQLSALKTGTDKNTTKCITGNNSTGWYDDADGTTSMPTTEPCRATVTDVQFSRGKAMPTTLWYAERGTVAQQIMAKKVLKAACDLGGAQACDYFINKCRTDASASSPYCDDANSFTDLTYYLHLNRSTYTNNGAAYIVNQLEGMLPKMMVNLLNEVFYSCGTDPNIGDNLACDLAKPEVFIKACNNGYSGSCTVSYDNNYNRSCSQIKTVWPEAPSGTYKLTYNGAGSPVSVSCDMTSLQSAVITGCNASPYVPGDCSYGYNNSINRTCEMVRLAWPYGPTGNYNLTTNGAPPTAPVATSCTMPDPHCTDTIGALCTDGTIYAGTYNGDFYFVPPANEAGLLTWNNGTQPYFIGATDQSNGLVNSNTILADTKRSPYHAAELCKSRNTANYLGHNDWYLPARTEIVLAYTAGVLDSSQYWTSTEKDGSSADLLYGMHGTFAQYGAGKTSTQYVRCVRQQATQTAGCTALGSVCADTSKYIGVANSKYIYTTPAKEPTEVTWDNNASTDIGTSNTTNGRANTDILVARTDSNAPYVAASVCKGKATSNYLGHNDWFLPASGEMAMILNNCTAIGIPSGYGYWASTGNFFTTTVYACGGGYQTVGVNGTTYRTRCARKQDVPTTTCIGTPGALCTDGTYYVGYYDGRHIYTTPNDEAGTYTWGPNNLICTTSGTNGNTNQATLEALGIASYPAAQACKALNALSYKGHTDWYLPARGEGALLTAQMSTLGLLGTYFTSTESSAINVFQVTTNYPGSTFDNATKWSAYKIRCTRDD